MVESRGAWGKQHRSRGRPRGTGLILGVLALGGAAYALLQSLVVPALTVLQQDLNASASGVAWIFTAYLLAASVVTPIAGRLGDIFGKKRVLVVALAGLALGSLMAALVSTLALMIVARVIQGLGGAIFPLAFGIIRDEFPPARIAGSIGLMSGLLGIGGGLGIVLSGIILDNLSYHWLFWIPLVVTSIAMLATIFFVPESPVRAPSGVNWGGAVLLSGWLTALLLATSQAHTWGWISPKTLGHARALRRARRRCGSAPRLRSRHPLVDMTRHAPPPGLDDEPGRRSCSASGCTARSCSSRSSSRCPSRPATASARR